MKPQIFRRALIGVVVLIAVGVLFSTQIYAQGAKKSPGGKVCPDPTVPCKTTATFEPYDLPFQIRSNTVIWESEQFYAIVLKSVASQDDNCDVFFPEVERMEAQVLFPKMKVFASRCTIPGSLFYTNVAPNRQFMAVFAGTTKAQANRMLATVKGTGKFPGASIRRIRAGFNGT